MLANPNDRDGLQVGLKAVISDINTIAENLRPLYVQDGDRFKLDVEAVDGFELDNVSGLKTALKSERSISAGLNDKLKTFEGIEPTSARNAITRLADFGDIDPAKARKGLADAEKFAKFNPETEAERIAETKFNNSKTQLQADFLTEKTTLAGEITTLKDTLAKRNAQIEKSLKDGVITAELAKVRPIPEAMDLLAQMASNVVKLQEVDGEFKPVVIDADGRPRVKLAADYSSIPFTVSDLMAEMRDKRAALFQPDEKRGLGTERSKSNGSAAVFEGANPFAKNSFNMTQQMIVMRKDPDLAARLKAEAGA